MLPHDGLHLKIFNKIILEIHLQKLQCKNIMKQKRKNVFVKEVVF